MSVLCEFQGGFMCCLNVFVTVSKNDFSYLRGAQFYSMTSMESTFPSPSKSKPCITVAKVSSPWYSCRVFFQKLVKAKTHALVPTALFPAKIIMRLVLSHGFTILATTPETSEV